MKNIIASALVAILLVVPGVFGCRYFSDEKTEHSANPATGSERASGNKTQEAADSHSPGVDVYYTCPMHPSVHKNAPGACPICGMTLVKKTVIVTARSDEKIRNGFLSISDTKRVLANVATVDVQRVSLIKDIRAVGTTEYPEPGIGSISMRFPGRIEKLYLTYTGQIVHAGEAVAEVYSPDAITAEQEYLLAIKGSEEVSNATESIASGASSLADGAREKLLKLGFTKSQIDLLDSTKSVGSTVTISSPLNGIVVKKYADLQQYLQLGEKMFDLADPSILWVNASIYENELSLVKPGQPVSITDEAHPGKILQGTVNFISPAIDPDTRTATVRIGLPNPHGELKAGMFVTVMIHVQLAPAIVVPVSAVISTGTKSIVWIEIERNRYAPRIVVPGVRNLEQVQILSGLDEGEKVVSSGGYLLDSESQLEMENAQDTSGGK